MDLQLQMNRRTLKQAIKYARKNLLKYMSKRKINNEHIDNVVRIF